MFNNLKTTALFRKVLLISNKKSRILLYSVSYIFDNLLTRESTRGACVSFKNLALLARMLTEQAEKVPLNLNRIIPA